MTPTPSQIKADVAALMPEKLKHCDCGCRNCAVFIWIDTNAGVTPREWLAVAHEVVLTLDGEKNTLSDDLGFRSQKDHFIEALEQIVYGKVCEEEVFFATVNASDEDRLEAIHRVMFPEKWRDGV